MSREELVKILEEMDIPEKRRDLSSVSNLSWLMRNIRVRNGNHLMIREVLEEIKRLFISCN